MMPRTARLTRSAFQGILSSSRRKNSVHFSVNIRKNEENKGSCAAVVSKKVAKSAVARHLLKRRILAVSKEFVSQPFSFIVYARAGAQTLTSKLLSIELKKLLSDAFAEM